jgi:hypothetical protein
MRLPSPRVEEMNSPDDRANQGKDDGDFKTGEDRGRRRRQFDIHYDRQPGRRDGSIQIDQGRVGRPHPCNGVYKNRKKHIRATITIFEDMP